MKNKIQKIAVDKIVSNPDNPRVIRDHKFKKLVNSIKEFPDMLQIRPLVVDEDMVVLGGNMRFEALKSLGHIETYVLKVEGLTDAQKKEFIIKDNQSFGEWNWETLANDWKTDELIDWGFEPYQFGIDEAMQIEDDEDDKEEAKIDAEAKVSLRDDEYSSWDIILTYENKLKLIDALKKCKEENDLIKTEDALMLIVNTYLNHAGK